MAEPPFKPHDRSVSRGTNLSQPITPVVPDIELSTVHERQARQDLEAALLDLAASHVSEVQHLQWKLEASIQALEARHFAPPKSSGTQAPALAADWSELCPRDNEQNDEGSNEEAEAKDVTDGAKVEESPTDRTAEALERQQKKARMRMSSAISRVLKGPSHIPLAKHHRMSKAPETLRLRRKMLNQKPFAADRYGDVDPEELDKLLPWYERYSLLWLVTHPFFDAVTALVILVNAATIGAETQYGAMDVQMPPGLDIVSQVCSVYFLFELAVRIGAHKMSWISDPDMRLWNMFDFLLVAMSLMDYIIVRAMDASAGFTEVKMIKTLRIIRIFRVFRFFRQLTQLALMITDSIKSLIWALVLLAIIIYAFAIFLTANVSAWLQSHLEYPGIEWPLLAAEHADPDISALGWAYGSLPQTVYTLVQAVLGGRSWHEVCTPLFKVGWLPVMLLFIYISFVILAVLNVVTGVFVDNAFRCAEKQRSLAIQKEMDRREQFTQQIKDFFHAMDQDGSGDVTADELLEMLGDPTLSAYFRVLGFDIDDANRFILLLDKDSSGSISMDEFLKGCLRYRGGATGVDMHTCLRLVRRMEQTLLDVHSQVTKKDKLSKILEGGLLQGPGRTVSHSLMVM